MSEPFTPKYTYFIDGLDVRDWTLLKSILIRPQLSARNQSLQVAGRSGIIPVPRLAVELEPLQLDLALAPAADNPGTLEVMLDRLSAVLLDPQLTVIRRKPRGEDDTPQLTRARAELVSAGPEVEDRVSGLWARWKVSLRLPEAQWRDLKPKTAILAPGKRKLAGMSGVLPVRDAVVRARGPLSRLVLLDVLTGTGISWTGRLAEGEELLVDCGALTATKPIADGEVDATEGLDFPPAGRLALTPAPVNARLDVVLDVDGWADGVSGVSLEVRRAWL